MSGAPSKFQRLQKARDFKQKIKKVFEASGFRPYISPVELIHLKPLLERQGVKPSEVITVLNRTPTLAACALKVIQSPQYTNRKNITSLKEAVVRLGSSPILEIIGKLPQNFPMLPVQPNLILLERFRKHSVATAHISFMLATVLKLDYDLAYLCGLFHDLGILGSLMVLLRSDPGNTAPTFEGYWDVVHPLHEEMGEVFASGWDLGEVMTQVMAQHHRFDPRYEPSRYSQIVCLAEHLARKLGYPIITIKDNKALSMEFDVSSMTNVDQSIAQLKVPDNVLMEIVNLASARLKDEFEGPPG